MLLVSFNLSIELVKLVKLHVSSGGQCFRAKHIKHISHMFSLAKIASESLLHAPGSVGRPFGEVTSSENHSWASSSGSAKLTAGDGYQMVSGHVGTCWLFSSHMLQLATEPEMSPWLALSLLVRDVLTCSWPLATASMSTMHVHDRHLYYICIICLYIIYIYRLYIVIYTSTLQILEKYRCFRNWTYIDWFYPKHLDPGF